MKGNVLKKLYKTNQTVFSFKELLLTFSSIDEKTLRATLHYYAKKGDLYHIRRGLYAKNEQYNRLELATKIFIPSYISFETVLASEGIIFQYYSQIFVASYQSREIVCDNQSYIFRRLKETILTDPLGIEMKQHYSIATKERAFLDIVYLHKSYHFDNLAPLNWDLIYEMIPLYTRNSTMLKRVKKYHTAFKKGL